MVLFINFACFKNKINTNELFIQRILSIRQAHLDYYDQNKNSIIYINRDNLDFEKEADLKKVLQQLELS